MSVGYIDTSGCCGAAEEGGRGRSRHESGRSRHGSGSHGCATDSKQANQIQFPLPPPPTTPPSSAGASRAPPSYSTATVSFFLSSSSSAEWILSTEDLIIHSCHRNRITSNSVVQEQEGRRHGSIGPNLDLTCPQTSEIKSVVCVCLFGFDLAMFRGALLRLL